MEGSRNNRLGSRGTHGGISVSNSWYNTSWQGIGEGLTSQEAVLRGKATMQVCEGRSHIPSTSLSLRRASGGTVLLPAIHTPHPHNMRLLLISWASLRFRNRQKKCEIMKYRYSLIYQGTVSAVVCNVCI